MNVGNDCMEECKPGEKRGRYLLNGARKSTGGVIRCEQSSKLIPPLQHFLKFCNNVM